MANNNRIKKLKLTTENSGVSIYPACLVGKMLTSHMHKITSLNYPRMLCVFKNGKNQWANDIDAANRISKLMIRKLEKRPESAKEIFAKYKNYAKQLSKLADKILSITPKSSFEDLLYLYHKYNDAYTNVHLHGWLPLATEGFEGNFSKRVTSILRKYRKESMPLGDLFNILTLRRTFTIREHEYLSLLNVISYIKNKKYLTTQFEIDPYSAIKSNSSLKALLDKHYQDYCWMTFDYEGPKLKEEYFIDRLITLFKNNLNPAEEVFKLKRQISNTMKRQKQVLSSLRIENDLDKKFINMVRMFLEWKEDLQGNLFRSYYAIDKLIWCIAKKKKISKQLVRNVLPEEIEDFVFHGMPSINQIKERIRFCLMICSQDKVSVEIGKNARDIMHNEIESPEISRTTVLEGQGVYPGIVKGRVKIIMDTKDMNRMSKGGVLVSSKTNPNLLPAIMKASAIVTDYGGITCHAAIISQEMKIPAVIGTKIATKLLKNNMLVKVDAYDGVVEILKSKAKD